MTDPIFNVGDLVQRKNQPEMIGRVVTVHLNPQNNTYFYAVDFPGGRRGSPEFSLVLFEEIGSAWDALKRGLVSGREHFRTLLTFHRLKKPPSRIANSYATAKTTFYPYQFKPLLKFLDNPSKRILIADEVGLGKTIEAGYILKELCSHQDGIEKVLVLVPSRLRNKWKKELSSRFDETFDLISRQDLIRMAERIKRGKEPEPFKWIVSYEGARSSDVIEAFEETQVPIDVLIADEVHWMRNPETLQHRLGRTLTECADVAVFLSATPVQNTMNDLHTILRILYPETFADSSVFFSIIAVNALIISLQSVVQQQEFNRDEALDILHRYELTPFGRQISETALFASIRERMTDGVLQKRDIAELQSDIAQLSPIGHILSRSKKKDVQEDAPKREAKWISVPLKDAEQDIYDSVRELCKLVGLGGDTSFGFQMALMMAYRITASCIPASHEYFRGKVGILSAGLSDDLLKLEEEDKEEDVDRESVWLRIPRERIQQILELYQFIGQDSKFEKFMEALQLVWKDSGRRKRKVIVFSYFPGTVIYLQERLIKSGIRCLAIHGRIPVRKREEIIDEFLEHDDVLVLLSTDVGAEGIDLQRASVVINYDLPWNPMVVEQRIGRIDRVGQTAKRIHIVNLVIENSIEETILQRLLQKIEIFRETIGEPDPIIGGLVEELTVKALSGEFSPEQLEIEVERKSQVISQMINEARKMMSEVDKMISADQALIDEIGALIGERQIPTSGELLQFLNRFLAIRYPGCQIPDEVSRRVIKVDLRGNIGNDMEQVAGELGGNAWAFARRINTGPVDLTLSREAGHRHPRAEMIHFKHPLSRFAIREFEKSRERRQGAFALRLKENKYLPNGSYGFLIVFFEIEARHNNRRMIAIFKDLEKELFFTEQEETVPLTLEMLDKAEEIELTDFLKNCIIDLEKNLVSQLLKIKSDWDQREMILEQNRREMQNTTIKATLDVRQKRASERVELLRKRNAMPFAIKMAEARLQKALKELKDHEERSSVQLPWREIEWEEIACGILTVG